jgi:hypothetical protein
MTSWQIISVLFLQENKTSKLTNNIIHLQSLNYSGQFCWFEVNLLYHASELKDSIKLQGYENLLFTISKHETPNHINL